MRRWWLALLMGMAIVVLGLTALWPPGRFEDSVDGVVSPGRAAAEPSPGRPPDAVRPRSPREPAGVVAAGRSWSELALRDAATRRRSLHIDPGAAILFERAETRMRDGDWDEAIVQFRDVINRHPTAEWVPLAFASIADAHLLKGDLESLREARRQLESYTGLFADSPGAERAALKRNLLNLLLDGEGRVRADARHDLLQFLRGSPDEESARLAEYLLNLSDLLPQD